MLFPKEFFEGEYREDFYVEPMMKRNWAAQLEVLNRITDICDKYGIKYFALWGTLLGAIRHRGFIPWDDDIDIAMLREDFEVFFEVAKNELPSEYKLLTFYTEPEWEMGLGRVTNNDGIMVTQDKLSIYHGCPFSVGIDIFPYDYIPDDEETKSQLNNLLTLIYTVKDAVSGTIKENGNNNPALFNENINIGLDYLENMFGFRFNRSVHLINQLDCLYDQVISSYGNKDSRFVTCYIEKNKRKNDFKIPSFMLNEITELPFENITIRVPKYYEVVMSICYGRGYMTPVKGGAGHDYPCYKAQLEFMNEHDLDIKYEEAMKEYEDECSEEEYVPPLDYFLSTENKSEKNNEDKKKTILYCLSSMDVYETEEEYVSKVKDTLSYFSRNNDKVNVILSEDSLIYDILDWKDETLSEKLRAVISSTIEDGWCQYIAYEEVPKYVNECDAYYGSGGKYLKYFTVQKKPVMVHNLNIINIGNN